MHSVRVKIFNKNQGLTRQLFVLSDDELKNLGKQS